MTPAQRFEPRRKACQQSTYSKACDCALVHCHLRCQPVSHNRWQPRAKQPKLQIVNCETALQWMKGCWRKRVSTKPEPERSWRHGAPRNAMLVAWRRSRSKYSNHRTCKRDSYPSGQCLGRRKRVALKVARSIEGKFKTSQPGAGGMKADRGGAPAAESRREEAKHANWAASFMAS
jgi:hypothetical protein